MNTKLYTRTVNDRAWKLQPAEALGLAWFFFISLGRE